jgi:hypothetical protein
VNLRTIWIALGVLIGLGLPGAPLRAQSTNAPAVSGGDDKPWNRGVPTETRQAARDMFLEGNRLFSIPLFARAAEKYLAALSKWKHPAFYFNLALAQLNLGQEVEAHENLKQAVRQGEEPLGAEQFHEAQKQLAELEHQLGRLRVNCPTTGAEVTLDGAPVFTGAGSYEAWVKPTTHEVSATRPNYLPKASRVAVRPGERKSLDMQLVALSDAEQTRWAVWKPWAVVASAAVVGLASGGLHAISRQGFKTYDDGFQRLPCLMTGCSESDIGADLNGQLRHATLEQKIAVGGYITASALITTAAIMLYLNRPRLVEQDTTDPPRPRLTIIPAMSGDMLGVQVIVSR